MVAAGDEDEVIVMGADRDVQANAPTLPSPASGRG